MSSESSVGFAFQADVANTGSLLHLLTGKALKALSDGGVDFYSITVAITLGKDFEVRNSLGNTVPAHVKSKRGIQSVLSKVLSIGWGQPELAIAMTKTKAGVNALLLIDALACGSTYYQAAECFSSLLSLRGCEADKLPNVDVLKHMIGYLAPFLLGLGFSRVVAHITTTATRAIRLNHSRDSKLFDHLTRSGDASSVAGAINQLMLTSGRKESCYMPTRMRGAWLSAFASHVLGMAVELRLDDAIIWESAGSNGTAIFELGEYQAEDSHFQAIVGQRITIIELPDPENQDSMLDNCLPIDMIFASVIAHEPDIDISLQQDIQRAICRFSFKILRSLQERAHKVENTRFYTNFKVAGALRETLNAFGFQNSIIDSVENQPPAEEIPTNMLNALDWQGIQSLGPEAYDKLRNACGRHGDDTTGDSIHSPNRSRCRRLCGYVNRLIVGFTSSVLLLSQCRFDASQLSIYPDVLLDDIRNQKNINGIPYSYLLEGDYLKSILLLVDHDTERGRGLIRPFILGISGKSFTVCHTSILSYDCFDNQGRFLTILPGRASVAGAFRSEIVEKYAGDMGAEYLKVPVSTLLAPGLSLMPHHAPPEGSIFMGVSFDENVIFSDFKVRDGETFARGISIKSCTKKMLDAQSVSCPHEPTSELQVQKEQNLAVVGFGALNSSKGRNQDIIQLVALHGNKLEQLLTFGMIESDMDARYMGFIFQHMACLKCCISTAKNEGKEIVIMGG
ncbi:hypothetical protein F4813DRAFT_357202 [Daldinia decipiens]|uniref:uncharacterized protein n=1 Tax=Daldinia decipiens TaxID=326647 RepID=UPI0020C5523D|nr:uncharacterized protein F4813DRAFT_357202 [Daldinia decipiens]KAI1658057.1 hypothetical protein F4813DRAFT_357202 [Daldinia decipiens]